MGPGSLEADEIGDIDQIMEATSSSPPDEPDAIPDLHVHLRWPADDKDPAPQMLLKDPDVPYEPEVPEEEPAKSEDAEAASPRQLAELELLTERKRQMTEDLQRRMKENEDNNMIENSELSQKEMMRDSQASTEFKENVEGPHKEESVLEENKGEPSNEDIVFEQNKEVSSKQDVLEDKNESAQREGDLGEETEADPEVLAELALLTERRRYMEQELEKKRSQASITEVPLQGSVEGEEVKGELDEGPWESWTIAAASEPISDYFATTDAVVLKVEEVYENERYQLFGKWSNRLLPTDRHNFSNHDGSVNFAGGLESVPCPDGWQWKGEWGIDRVYALVDADGWSYGLDFSVFTPDYLGVATPKSFHVVRRRRWIRQRFRQKVDEERRQQALEEQKASDGEQEVKKQEFLQKLQNEKQASILALKLWNTNTLDFIKRQTQALGDWEPLTFLDEGRRHLAFLEGALSARAKAELAYATAHANLGNVLLDPPRLRWKDEVSTSGSNSSSSSGSDSSSRGSNSGSGSNGSSSSDKTGSQEQNSLNGLNNEKVDGKDVEKSSAPNEEKGKMTSSVNTSLRAIGQYQLGLFSLHQQCADELSSKVEVLTHLVAEFDKLATATRKEVQAIQKHSELLMASMSQKYKDHAAVFVLAAMRSPASIGPSRVDLWRTEQAYRQVALSATLHSDGMAAKLQGALTHIVQLEQRRISMTREVLKDVMQRQAGSTTMVDSAEVLRTIAAISEETDLAAHRRLVLQSKASVSPFSVWPSSSAPAETPAPFESSSSTSSSSSSSSPSSSSPSPSSSSLSSSSSSCSDSPSSFVASPGPCPETTLIVFSLACERLTTVMSKWKSTVLLLTRDHFLYGFEGGGVIDYSNPLFNVDALHVEVQPISTGPTIYELELAVQQPGLIKKLTWTGSFKVRIRVEGPEQMARCIRGICNPHFKS